MTPISVIRRVAIALAVATAALAATALGLPAPARAADYLPGVVLVGYRVMPAGPIAARDASMGVREAGPAEAPNERMLRLAPGIGVWAAIERLRRQPEVAYAVPDYLAHTDGTPEWIPNDPGKAGVPGGWEKMQWNFLPGEGVNAPEAWANLIADDRPGGRGVIVAVLDTGVAYRDWHQFRKSPDFQGARFTHPYDFVANNRFPLDRNGHGTFVAGEIAESTNNGFGLTGLAYGATIMPVRVLNEYGWGDAVTISKGIRYAARHGARVINLSLEFDPSVTAGEIPDIMSAIRYANRRGAVVVAAAGNEGLEQIAYPARAPTVISVGATTADGCLADYSNGGTRLDLVAPGGGDDASLPDEPNCQPERDLPDIYQMTFVDPSNPRRFGFPGGWFGTSMSAPEVAATAALVIASGVIGHHPSPQRVLARLEATAQPLGGTRPNSNYGFGLLDAGAATAPTAPTA